jgi:ppGpp synthetase/RelA/SpoT-type nucleotidyltranferase
MQSERDELKAEYERLAAKVGGLDLELTNVRVEIERLKASQEQPANQSRKKVEAK